MVNVGRATVDVDAELDRTSIAALGKKIEAALEKSGKKAGGRFSKQFDIAVGKTANRIGLITSAAPLAASAISALSGSVVALSASLFNAVSSSAALTGVLGSLGQTAIVATIGFRNFGKAIVANNAKKFNLAINHMAPAMIGAVKAVRSLSGEYFKFTRSLQTAIFDGTSKQINRLANVFLPLLQKQFTRTGGIINHIFDSLVKFGTSIPFLTQFGKALQGNNKILSTLGRAVVPAVAGLLHVFLALQPASERLSLSIVRLAKQFQIVTRQAGFAKGVDAFMIRASASAKLLLSLTGNLGGALFNIFSAATPAGDSLLQTLVNITQRFQDFTASAKGKSAIAKWAADGVSAMSALGTILGKFGKVFASISDPKILAAFTSILSSFADTLVTLSPLIQSFSSTLASLLSRVAPILGPVLALAVVFNGLTTTLALLGGLVGTVVGPLATLFKVLKFLGPILKVVAIGFRILGAAILANPIVLISLALIALGAALVIAYKKSETFRNIVNGVWSSIKTAAIATLSAIAGFVGPIFSKIGSVISVAMNVIKTVVQVVWTIIKDVIYVNLLLIAGVVAVNVVLIRSIITTAFNAIMAVVNFVWPTISRIISSVMTVITAVVTIQFKLIKAVVTTVLNAILAVVNFVWPTIHAIISRVLGAIFGVVSRIFNSVKNVVTTVFTAVRGVISAGVNAWFSIISGIVGKIGGLAGKFLKAGKSLGKSVIDGLAAGLKAAGGFVSDIAGSIKRAINSTLHLPFTIHGPGPLPDFTIPAFATGVRNFDGGVALVGERGPELVNLPGGSDVHTAEDTRGILGAGAPFVYSPNFYGPTTSSGRLRELDWTIRYATAARSERVVV